jgi:hypothetical protein
MSVWTTPHGSTKYALIPNPVQGYFVVAVHALDPAGQALVSVQGAVGDTHGYYRPQVVRTEDILWMAQTTEAAWKQKRRFEEQDREAEQANG